MWFLRDSKAEKDRSVALYLEGGLRSGSAESGNELLAVPRVGQDVTAIGHGCGAGIVHFKESGCGLFRVETANARHFVPGDFLLVPEIAHAEAAGVQFPVVE